MQSSLKFRPKTFSSVIGQAKVLRLLSQLWKKKKFPNALMFHGPSGVGKSTIARIVARSINCTHSRFGYPCKICRPSKGFPIYELNASEDTGKDKVKEFVSGSLYGVLIKGTRKVFILDEAHKLSDSAQNLLLKYIENDQSDVLWIICTTRPENILDTLRQRCRSCKCSNFSLEDVKDYTGKLLKLLGSELAPDPLVDELYENRITSGRLIANAVDNYVSGLSPEEAIAVDIEVNIETKPLCRAVTKGDWATTSSILKKSSKTEAKLLKASVLAYLVEIMLNDSEISDRTTAVSKAILQLSNLHSYDAYSQYSGLTATLYQLCKLFKGIGL